MKITVVTGPFYPVPPAPCGAVERLMDDLARAFADAGHDVTICCRHWPGQAGDEAVGGVRYVRRGEPTTTGDIRRDLLKDFYYSLVMLRAAPAADVVVTNVFWLPWLLARFRRSAGRIVVNVNRRPKGQMRLYRRAARIVAASSAIEAEIVAQCPPIAPITRTIPNPIDTATFTPPPGGRDVGRPGPRTVLYTGRVHPEKGLDLLVDAFTRLHDAGHDVRLKIVGVSDADRGGGGEAFAASLRARAGGRPVEVLPPVYDRPAFADLLRSADVYCYPSTAEKGEAMPVAPLEAMATGLAPVVSDLPQFRDYLRPGETGVTFDHRGDGAAGRLADAIAGLLDEPARRESMGRAAAETAAGYSTERVAAMYLDDFATLVGKDA